MNNIYKNTPPHNCWEVESDCKTDVRTFLLELRKDILNITIERLNQCMNWSNEKYYNKIVNGQIDKKDNSKKYSEPTVKWLFESLNHAFKYYEEFQDNKEKIIKLIYKYIIRF